MNEKDQDTPASQALAREQDLKGPSGNPVPPSNDRFPRLFGLIVILIAFGFVGGWASLAPIDSAVVAQGTVTVDSYRQTVQHLEGGIIRTLHVRDGATVERGDLLIQLDETQARSSYLVNYNRYLAELARRARLEAELEGEERIDFPEELTGGAEGEGRATRVMATEEREFKARREALDGEVSVLRQRIDQLQERIEGMQSQRQSRLRTIASLEEELESRGRLAERELLPAAELRPLERQLAEAEGEAGELQASIAGARIEIGEAELQIIQLRRELSREVAAALRETNTQIDALEEELQALEDTLRRKQIRAPVDGEVVNMRFHAEWAVIGPGEPILDLVPGDEPLVVEARVRPQDIDSVTLGQPADVRFTAFSFRTTPVVEGEVIFVSADSLEDSQTGESYFLSRIVVGEEEMRQLGAVSLRPGMPADVMIKTGERTPMAYLMKPLTDALARAFTED
ncbi:HlyD family type I secretion periplasmic adaptor subunit [Ectothiorhodospira haloalkaliphila]|uniref:HlyD family type I secretion periplasmic adaptor subunit n=1 Tax=Ectothiorhodospira haloalkaliphila TaxID=421628 RepID=UPI001EE8ED75|nr:HlyD family type I secretion periplasmic adaptor subunit [Ectothiorhodospira haloalkaliphila]MCG5526251.1 HlyD family type I secretion periplasmic adaptor subunit [Ectothiorhodospira haloalkaliphila]